MVSIWLPSELVEEAKVVLEEQANVGDAVLAHGKAFDAESEGPAGVLFAVDADGVKDVRIYHTAAAHFNPGREH